MTMNKTLLKQVQAHAQAELPRECCGVVIRENGRRVYVPCRNDAQTPSEHFIINPEDQCAAEDRGEIVEIVHSHPNALAAPSMADRVSCELHGVPWFILGWPGGDTATIKPEGYQAPLLDREFHHGILDCYALVRDWYAREWSIDLPNFPRRDGWWNEGESLYTRHYEDAGFYRAADLRKGDLIVMQIAAHGGAMPAAPNHAGVYLGDGLLSSAPDLHAAPGTFLHHRYGKRSTRDVYGGMWAERTVMILRHQRAPEST
ncbi:C40 family peptidase [Pseudomonas sp. B21-032]|nr:C40 family peptidase [Pseudomonas sp. B21-032]UVL59821.1 C40 family peptidase [Pseudomonas sp. B21-032]